MRISTKGYTGCRVVKGSHGIGHVYDVLGKDRPPSDWTHEKPSRAEIRAALAEQAKQAVAT